VLITLNWMIVGMLVCFIGGLIIGVTLMTSSHPHPPRPYSSFSRHSEGYSE